ncbi:hypothetical protein FHG87_013928 [Trinorchestia longiramus]|nr:hypothetical protein FHG87_013928 [Trinorchestia longiramus]
MWWLHEIVFFRWLLISEFRTIPTHKPLVIRKHGFIPTALISLFHYRNIVMESLSVLITESYITRREKIQIARSASSWNEGNTRLCLQYNRGVEETVEHLVLECSKYEQERESLMDVVHEQCGENKWNAKCVEEDSDMRYLVGLDEECNMTVVDAMKDFLVHAWNKRQGC